MVFLQYEFECALASFHSVKISYHSEGIEMACLRREFWYDVAVMFCSRIICHKLCTKTFSPPYVWLDAISSLSVTYGNEWSWVLHCVQCPNSKPYNFVEFQAYLEDCPIKKKNKTWFLTNFEWRKNFKKGVCLDLGHCIHHLGMKLTVDLNFRLQLSQE